ncbi:MAG: glycosyl hydrolase [Bacteroidota bacterium]|nr:glycosyl hydrolase [Bacteroidota bacterium]
MKNLEPRTMSLEPRCKSQRLKAKSQKLIILFISLSGLFNINTFAQADKLKDIFLSPPESAKPWVFWYWMHAAVTRKGITADLEALKQNGIGGVYLVPINGVDTPPLITPAAEQLSPQWWTMIRFAFDEADRLGIKIAMHASDGFATAGGPWITPELSMQKVVWTETRVSGKQHFNGEITKPESYQGYYHDIAVLAFPTIDKPGQSTRDITPKVTTSTGANGSFLPMGNKKDTFSSDDPCWIQYEFNKPFTCRSLTIITGGTNYQSHRFKIETSNDGKNFQPAGQLNPPRHGWYDFQDNATYAIKSVTARYFRFSYNKEGTEPAAEDLENAKWKPALKVKGIVLSSAPHIHQYEGKNGQVWRVATHSTSEMIPDSLCIPLNKVINITDKLDANGKLNWDVPAGNWTILRIGHTSTGRMNGTAGAAKGLECDKLNPEAVKFQYSKWFGEITQRMGKDLTSRVLKYLHVDSWECGSQNWSPTFREEFKKRRGYDLLPYLPAMAGIPVANANTSERFLADIRQTVADLVADNFYGTITGLTHTNGYQFTGESVAPVMLSDGMLHYKYVDIPMGEFWYKSPTHDKPSDILDATSGGHIYGRNIIQAEAFTTVRMDWSENPAVLKTLQDLNYSLGINRFVFHVSTLNPWLDRKPGMTLNGVGLYFQRDQTWWKPAKAWMDYTQRCQALLQQGVPVTDVAVFTGEETPRRAFTPDRFVSALPGIFGEDRVKSEANRLANKGVPTRSVSLGVTASDNMYEPQKWADPLRGYAFDSFNQDALLRLATVKKNGRIELPGGASYGVLVIPGKHPMQPESKSMSPEVAQKLLQLAKDGATIIVNDRPETSPSLSGGLKNDKNMLKSIKELWGGETVNNPGIADEYTVGKGKVIHGPFKAASFDGLNVPRDFIALDENNIPSKDIAWAHRTDEGFDIYFVSNQQAQPRTINLSLRVSGRVPEIWNPVTGETMTANQWKIASGRTELPVKLEANGSSFIVLRQSTQTTDENKGKNWEELVSEEKLNGSWQVTFDPKFGGPEKPVVFEQLDDWSKNADSTIRYYSGTAVYSKSFTWNTSNMHGKVCLNLGRVANIASVKVNGIDCGVAWTSPFKVDISKALKPGENQLSIEVTNTWANRLIGDQRLSEKQRITWTTAPFRLDGKPLLEAGLLGPVEVTIDN